MYYHLSAVLACMVWWSEEIIQKKQNLKLRNRNTTMPPWEFHPRKNSQRITLKGGRGNVTILYLPNKLPTKEAEKKIRKRDGNDQWPPQLEQNKAGQWEYSSYVTNHSKSEASSWIG